MANLALLHSPVAVANGASESGVIDVTERVIVAIHMPAAWTTAVITFLASISDSGPWLPVFDSTGTELSVTAAAGNVVTVPADATRAFRYVKIRSGTAGSPVTQGAARTVTLATVNDIAS